MEMEDVNKCNKVFTKIKSNIVNMFNKEFSNEEDKLSNEDNIQEVDINLKQILNDEEIKLNHGTQKTHQCSFEGCNKFYSNMSRLEIHQRTHVIIFEI